MIFQEVESELAVPHFVFRDELQDVSQYWLSAASRVLEEMMRGEVLAHHVASEQARGTVVVEACVAPANGDDLLVRDGTIADGLEVLSEDVEVLVALVELHAEEGGRRRVVPEKVERTRREDGEEGLD